MPVVTVNLQKAKGIAHAHRRAAREAEFAPHDRAIALQIPGAGPAAESARAAIREKYAAMQDRIDAAPDVATLTQIVQDLKASATAAAPQV